MIGGYIGENAGFEAARLLQPFFKIKWERTTSQGFFFRAEDFSDFINSVEKAKRKILNDLRELEGEIPEDIISRLSDGVNYSLVK